MHKPLVTYFQRINPAQLFPWAIAFLIHMGLAWVLWIQRPEPLAPSQPNPVIWTQIIAAPEILEPAIPEPEPEPATPLAEIIRPPQSEELPQMTEVKAPNLAPIEEQFEPDPVELPASQLGLAELPDAAIEMQSREERAAQMILRAPPGPQTTGTIAGFLGSLACHDPQNLDPACKEQREVLADVQFAYGRATMREGAGISAETRKMDRAELAAYFNSGFVYDGPPESLKDTSMDTMVGSADSMRDQLGHWPPDPVFGD